MQTLEKKDETITKKDLRKKALLERQQGDFKVISSKIVQKILNSDDFKNAKKIGLYLPIKNEIDLTTLLQIKEKEFYLPKCLSDFEMEFFKFEGENDLEENKWGIKEPKKTCPINPKELNIIYIPAIMANKKCYRLGFGKGFYDRFFEKYDIKAKKVIVLANCFVSDKFKEEKNDYKCDEILFE